MSHVWTPEELRALAEEIIRPYCTGQDDHDIENCHKCADMIHSVVTAFNNIIAGIAFVKATDEVITSAVDFVKKIAAQQDEPRPFDYTCAIHGKKISEHECLYCCRCFKTLTVEECHVRPDGQREDLCNECAETETSLMTKRMEEIRRRMKEIGTVFIQDGSGYHVVPGQEEAASFLADAAWTLSGALAQAERERNLVHDDAAAFKIERDAALAEVERLKALVAELKTSNERFHSQTIEWRERAEQAEADLARVRAALIDCQPYLTDDDVIEQARAALEGQK